MAELLTNPLVTLFVGAMLGAVAQRIVDVGWNSTVRSLRVTSKRKRVRRERGIEEQTRITTLAPFVPPIDWSDNRENIKAVIRPRPFFLAPPKDLLSKLDVSQFPQRDDVLPENFELFFQEWPEALEALEAARREIILQFIAADAGAHFNGRKYGVLRARPYERTVDVAELPKLRLEVYDTDYFTQRVMDRVRREIPELHERRTLQTLEELNGPRSIFRNALGLSVIVELSSTDEIIVTRRAPGAAYSDGKAWWYVSVTEAVSQSDFDSQHKEVDLFDAVRRGLQEELGIERSEIAEIRFLSAFFENNFFQDGLVVVVELKESVTMTDLKNRFPKDRPMEVSQLHTLKRNPTVLRKWVEEHADDARPQTLYALHTYRTLGL